MNHLIPFIFEKSPIRVVEDIDGIKVVAKDVADALGYKWQPNVIGHVPAEWKGVSRINTPGGVQQVSVLTEQGLYFFLGRSDKEKALPMQKWVAGEVLPSIRKTGGYQSNATAKLPGELAIMECYVRLLRPAPSCQVAMLEHIARENGLSAAFLPAYVVDAAPDSQTGSAMTTASLTALLKEHGITITPAAYNALLQDAGMLESRTRKTTSKKHPGGTKSFWAITEKGLSYGKNLTTPESPRETQPHWYVDRFAELHRIVTGRLIGNGGAA
jgi:hypothetical protein